VTAPTRPALPVTGDASPTSELEAAVVETTATLCRQVFHDRLRALVLTGSLARSEGTFVRADNEWCLLGDAEFLLVFDEKSRPPLADDTRLLSAKLEERTAQHGLGAEITLSPVRPGYLRRLSPSIFAYELKACGQVVLGEPDVLSLIPAFGVREIPLEDAWRLLANRLVEQLESVDELLEGRATLSPAAHYRAVKLYLDMATSLLVFVGGYAPTYEERAKTLRRLVEPPARTTSWPFPSGPFADAVEACTEWKLSASDSLLDRSRAFWERAIDFAQALWRWELARLQGVDAPPAALMTLWMRRQPLRQRLRGWAHVLRQTGWHRSLAHWPRWARQALVASPRYVVYAAATDLLFGLRWPNILITNGSSGGPHRLEPGRRLPLTPGAGAQNGGLVPELRAADVLFNYRSFLMNTRA
jgi:hypothetical protein